MHIHQNLHLSHIPGNLLASLFTIWRWAKFPIHEACPHVPILRCLIGLGQVSRIGYFGIQGMGTLFLAKVNFSNMGLWLLIMIKSCSLVTSGADQNILNLVLSRSPLYTLLLPFIHARSTMPPESDHELPFQYLLRERLSSCVIQRGRSRSLLFMELGQELQSMKESLNKRLQGKIWCLSYWINLWPDCWYL